jgi:hypothetical protein
MNKTMRGNGLTMEGAFKLVSYTLTQKIAALERELRFRFRVYPRRIAQGLMSQVTAAYEIEVMKAILDDYRKQRDPELEL